MPLPASRTLRSTLPLLLLGACTPDAPRLDASLPATLPVFAAAAEPDLEIGVLEGDDRLMFEQVVDVLRLGGGEIAVSDRQAARISVFSSEGTPLRSWGGTGDGPGEFRRLSRLYPGPGDSLFALDARDDRVSLFDRDGTYARGLSAAEISGDTLFTMDVWLHGRFLVDGVLAPDDRVRVGAVLDALPRPDGPGFRRVRASEESRHWIREPDAPGTGITRWVVLDADGRPLRLVDLPERLDADELSDDRVLGRWLGFSDVNFVRGYALEDTGETAPTPAWLLAPASADAHPPAVAVDLEAAARQAVRQAATAQEIHYSRHFRYATDTDSLGLEPVDGATLHLVSADASGWSGIVVHPELDRLCGLGYGSGTPPGWRGGTILCGR
jgi:hypothetical protein